MPGGRPKPLYSHANSAWWRRCHAPGLAGFRAKRNWLVHRLDIGVLDHFRPLGDFGLDIGIKFLGTTAAIGHAKVGEALFGVVVGQRFASSGVELGQNGAWRSGRRYDAPPRFRLATAERR